MKLSRQTEDSTVIVVSSMVEMVRIRLLKLRTWCGVMLLTIGRVAALDMLLSTGCVLGDVPELLLLDAVATARLPTIAFASTDC